MHEKEKPFSCDIPNCHARSKSRCDLDRHINQVHTKLKQFCCGLLQASDVVRYKVMGGRRVVTCTMCDEKFIDFESVANTSSSKMREHQENHHKLGRCGLSRIPRKDNFRVHLRTYHQISDVVSYSLADLCEERAKDEGLGQM